ncbi:Chloramphenicol acetyltransferase-like domain-containing protein, partial [Rozella allomycis CSF55]
PLVTYYPVHVTNALADYIVRVTCHFLAANEVIIKVPFLADSINQGTLASWEKKKGEYVAQDEPVAQIETDKIGLPVNAPESGTIVETFANEGDTVEVGQDLFKLAVGEGKSESAKPKAVDTKPSETNEKKTVETKAEASQVVTPTPSKPQPAATKVVPDTKQEPKINFGERSETRVKLSRMRLRIAERLKESQNTAASLTTFNEIDMTNLMEMRSLYKDDFQKKHSAKLGFMSAFIKASAIALQEIPAVNAKIDGGDLVYHNYVDISVAVATPKGLVTPVIRNVHQMGFASIEKTLTELGDKARVNQIAMEDLSGGTFTISNGGIYGSLMGTPIINPPQAGILGMHSIKERAVVVNGKIEIRPMMYVALTYDHRIIDGREAVTFLVKVKQLIEDPRRFLLDV